ncbi:MAG: DUF5916 domain-containing protein, partial [Bacteroidota bacterium]
MLHEWSSYWSVIVVVLCVPFASLAQSDQENFEPPVDPPIVRASRVSEGMTIDGTLDEKAWSTAEVISDFYRMEPRQGGQSKHQTEVRILFDDQNLYIGAICIDSLGKKGIRVQDLRRDFRWGENDIFLVALDPQNLKQYCVSFQTTPYGNQRDLQSFNDNIIDNDWNSLWTVRTKRFEYGYTAEFAIPFKSIRYKEVAKGDEPTWGITMGRLARRDYEQTVFPPIPQSFSAYRMTYAAQLKGLSLPQPSSNIRIEPYSLFEYNAQGTSDERIQNQKAKFGGDVKWAITPSSVLDVTVNTDFAQADVDRAVNNLERFNIFFPERRQFFLENSGIWAGSDNRTVVPFFSRTVGLQGNFNATSARIDAGARYTMRDERRAIAGLMIRQAESDGAAASNFLVGRYLQNYGSQNNVGVMLTHRRDDQSDRLGVSSSDNTTITVDGLTRPTNAWTVSYMLSASRDNSNDTLGVAGRFFAGNSSNKFYLGWLTNFVSQDYNPDMGFVFQKNVIWHNPGGYYIWRPENIPWIRRYDPGAFFDYYHDFSNPGQFQQASIYIFPVYVIFTNGSFLQYAITPTWQNINFEFSPLGVSIAQDNYAYTRHQIDF